MRYTLFADISGAAPGDRSMKRTRVEDVFAPGTRRGFHFDYGDDWMIIVKCDAVAPAAGRRKLAQVLKRTGTPPVQYPDCEEEEME